MSTRNTTQERLWILIISVVGIAIKNWRCCWWHLHLLAMFDSCKSKNCPNFSADETVRIERTVSVEMLCLTYSASSLLSASSHPGSESVSLDMLSYFQSGEIDTAEWLSALYMCSVVTLYFYTCSMHCITFCLGTNYVVRKPYLLWGRSRHPSAKNLQRYCCVIRGLKKHCTDV